MSVAYALDLIADRSAVGLLVEKKRILRVGYIVLREGLRQAQPEVAVARTLRTKRLHPELVEGSIDGQTRASAAHGRAGRKPAAH